MVEYKSPNSSYCFNYSYESITLGKNPNRQIIVYDKRGEVIAKRNPAWFEFWDIHPKDMTQTVHRVEIRLYKEELKRVSVSWNDESLLFRTASQLEWYQ